MERVDLFKSDFKTVAEHFTNAYTNPDYRPTAAVIRHVDEFLKLMEVLTGDKSYVEILSQNIIREGDGMDPVLEYRYNKGMEKGMEKVLVELVQEGLLSIEDAAKKLGVSVLEFEDLMNPKPTGGTSIEKIRAAFADLDIVSR